MSLKAKIWQTKAKLEYFGSKAVNLSRHLAAGSSKHGKPLSTGTVRKKAGIQIKRIHQI